MCVETLRTVLIFPRQLIWGVTSLHLLEKFTFSHLCPWKHYKCVLKASEQRSFFQDDWFEGSYLEFHWKNLRFPIYVLGSTINVCWNPHNMAWFSETIDLWGHMPRFTLKMNIFPSMSLRNPINVCWNPHNMACFSKTIDLRESHA